jgi:RNA polymerase sigma-70 factor (ECF subfamily)
MESRSEESLIRAAALGDRLAFDELVRRHLRALLRYATRLTGSPTTAEDITQETFLAAWAGLPRFAFRSSFRTWLFTIATRKTIDLERRRAAVVLPDETFETMAVSTPGPLAQTVEHSLFEALHRELGRLGYHARACWWLREVEGLSHQEIATALSISRGSVRGHLQRARAQLAERMAPWRPGVPDR